MARTSTRKKDTRPVPIEAARERAVAERTEPTPVPIEAARERALAERPEAALGSGQNAHIVILKCRDGYFGIDIAIVQEIVLMQEITPVPGSAPYVAGMTDLRGRVIPVAAFASMLNVPASDITDDTRILVVENGGGHIGFVVDAVTEVMMVGGGQIEDATAIGSKEHDFIVGVAKLEDHLVSLVDVTRLLAAADRDGVVAVAA